MAKSGSSGATPPVRVYGGQSASRRVAERRARLLEAGLELFGSCGVAATRVDDLCAEAGLTKRYFYESFSSVDELVEAVVDQAVADLAAVIVPAVISGGIRDPRPALDAFVTTILADRRLVRLLVVETHLGALTEKRQQLIELAVDLWLQSDPAIAADPQHLPAQRLLAHAMGGAVLEVCLAWANGRIELSAAEVVDHLVGIFDRVVGRT